MDRYAFAIYCDPEIRSEKVKALHALQYALALKKKGYEVLLYFDGLGTRVPLDSRLKPLVEEAISLGIVYGACGYCASPPHVGVEESLRQIKINLVGNEHDHKDLTTLSELGYQVIMV
jgi:predicted peroxiredoxin